MFHHSNVVQTLQGVAKEGVAVTVYAAGTTNLATLYSDDGVTATTNPVFSDTNGRYDFYLADGKYDFTYSGSNIATWTDEDVIIADYKDSNVEAGSTFTVETVAADTANVGAVNATTVTGTNVIGTTAVVLGSASGPQLLTGALDPGVAGVAAPLGSIYVRTGANPKWWRKDDTGDSDWGPADSTAFHNNVLSEISALTVKGTPVNDDILLIEDSAAANAKKRVTVGSLPSVGGGETNTGSSTGGTADVFKQKTGFDLEFRGITAGTGIEVTENATDIDIGFDTDTTDMFELMNAAFLDSPAVTVTESGGTVYANIEKSGTGDIRVVFSDGVYDWDCTPISQIALTAGSDASPTMNYVYLLQSTKTLTVDTSWPTTEHAPIATILVQSAASVATDGPYKMHAWTDHVAGSNDQGHLAHLNYWIRQQSATWQSGVALTPTAGAAQLDVATSAGVVLQLHTHDYPAFDTATGSDIYIVNDPTTAYDKKGDLTGLILDADGNTLGGSSSDYYNLVIWGVVNEASGDCKIMCNLPSGSYDNDNGDKATNDDDGTAIYTIPSDFTGVGFLIARLTVSVSGGTYTIENNDDLRGSFPGTAAGGGATGGNEFADNVFRIQDDGDTTKEIAFQASGLTTATTRTITMPDTDVDLADIATNTTKLAGIEDGADVTDTANVTAAGALMDSEVDADLKTFALPANTTISAFGATLVDDADAATARTTLGVDAAGTDNSKTAYMKMIYIEDPTATDEYPICCAPVDCTISEVRCITDTGTVDYNLETRAATTPDVAGTNVFAADDQASSTSSTATISDGDFNTGEWLHFSASAVASSPTKLWISIAFEED